MPDSPNVAVVKEYFRRSDGRRADVCDLLDDDIEVYFPKHGIGRGKAELARFGAVRVLPHVFRASRRIRPLVLAFADDDAYKGLRNRNGIAHVAIHATAEEQAQMRRRLEDAGYAPQFIDHGYAPAGEGVVGAGPLPPRDVGRIRGLGGELDREPVGILDVDRLHVCRLSHARQRDGDQRLPSVGATPTAPLDG